MYSVVYIIFEIKNHNIREMGLKKSWKLHFCLPVALPNLADRSCSISPITVDHISTQSNCNDGDKGVEN